MNTNIGVLNNFKDYLVGCRGYSKNTAEEYSLDLIDYFKYIISHLNFNIDIKDINIFILGSIERETILDYIMFLSGVKKNKPATRERHLASLKTFYKWLFLKYPNIFNGKENPCKNMPFIERQFRLPKYLNLETAKKLQNIFNKSNCKYPERDNLILKIFLNCGLRLAELQTLNIDDIDLNARVIKIIGKGNKQRKVYLNSTLADELQNYISKRENKEGALFLSQRKQRLSRKSIQTICKKAFEILNLDKKYTVHSLRHTAATILYESCNDILIVKEFLGHDTIESTQIYTHVSDRHLKEAMNRHPLNNI